jgi:hypothetical protein
MILSIGTELLFQGLAAVSAIAVIGGEKRGGTGQTVALPHLGHESDKV